VLNNGTAGAGVGYVFADGTINNTVESMQTSYNAAAVHITTDSAIAINGSAWGPQKIISGSGAQIISAGTPYTANSNTAGIGNGVTGYIGANASATELNALWHVASQGVINVMTCASYVAPGTGSYTCRLRVNSADTPLSCSWTGFGCTTTGPGQIVFRGDDIDIAITSVGGSAITYFRAGVNQF
jgi:hypothetical protein